MLALLLLLACGPPRSPVPAASTSVRTDLSAPSDAQAWYLKAVAAVERGDVEAAERALQWVARLDRRSPWPWMARGRLAERIGDLAAAEGAYRESLAVLETPEARLGLGRVRVKRGEVEAALPELAHAADAGSSEGMALLVQALVAVGRTEEARTRLVDWEPADRPEQMLRAVELAALDPALAAEAWQVLADVDDPALEDARAWLDSAREACVLDPLRAWLEERSAASWGTSWSELAEDAATRPAGCGTQSP